MQKLEMMMMERLKMEMLNFKTLKTVEDGEAEYREAEN